PPCSATTERRLGAFTRRSHVVPIGNWRIERRSFGGRPRDPALGAGWSFGGSSVGHLANDATKGSDPVVALGFRAGSHRVVPIGGLSVRHLAQGLAFRLWERVGHLADRAPVIWRTMQQRGLTPLLRSAQTAAM